MGSLLVALEVNDIDAGVDRLKANGIVFDVYCEPGSIIVPTPFGRDAYLKDSEGDVLNFFQRPAHSSAQGLANAATDAASQGSGFNSAAKHLGLPRLRRQRHTSRTLQRAKQPTG